MENSTCQIDLLKITEMKGVNQMIIKNTMISIFEIINEIWPKYLHNNNVLDECDNERMKKLRCRNGIELKKDKKNDVRKIQNFSNEFPCITNHPKTSQKPQS